MHSQLPRFLVIHQKEINSATEIYCWVILAQNVNVKFLLTLDIYGVVTWQLLSGIIALISSGVTRLYVLYFQGVITLGGIVSADTKTQTMIDLAVKKDEDRIRYRFVSMKPRDVSGRWGHMTRQFDYVTFLCSNEAEYIRNNWPDTIYKQYPTLGCTMSKDYQLAGVLGWPNFFF